MKKIFLLFSLVCLFAASFTSCSDTKSYAELLADEKTAIKYLVNYLDISAIAVDEDQLATYKKEKQWGVEGNKHFETNQWYRFPDNNNMYMEIVDFGDTSRLFSQINNPVITIRFDSCYNLLTFETLASSHTNNKSSVLGWLLNPYNPNYTSSLGQGIEFPIPFIGDGAHFRLIIPSKMGNSTDMANVVPYYYRNIYFDEAYQYPD